MNTDVFLFSTIGNKNRVCQGVVTSDRMSANVCRLCDFPKRRYFYTFLRLPDGFQSDIMRVYSVFTDDTDDIVMHTFVP